MVCCVLLCYVKPMFLSQVRNILKGAAKKKMVEIVKEELLSSILEMEDQDDLDLDEAVKHTKEPQEAITIIKRYDKILKKQNKKIINILGKQGLLLKWFKEADGFMETTGAIHTYTSGVHYISSYGNFRCLKPWCYHQITSKHTLNWSRKFLQNLTCLVKKTTSFIWYYCFLIVSIVSCYYCCKLREFSSVQMRFLWRKT